MAGFCLRGRVGERSVVGQSLSGNGCVRRGKIMLFEVARLRGATERNRGWRAAMVWREW
jgi:hypothetical protein